MPGIARGYHLFIVHYSVKMGSKWGAPGLVFKPGSWVFFRNDFSAPICTNTFALRPVTTQPDDEVQIAFCVAASQSTRTSPTLRSENPRQGPGLQNQTSGTQNLLITVYPCHLPQTRAETATPRPRFYKPNLGHPKSWFQAFLWSAALFPLLGMCYNLRAVESTAKQELPPVQSAEASKRLCLRVE